MKPTNAPKLVPRLRCLPDGSGYLRARLKGSIDAELDWGNENTACTGAVRPADGGIRMRFTRELKADQTHAAGDRLVLVFGIAGLREGDSARVLPVNVTVIREGNGEFYGTQGDDKCTLDTVAQTPLVGIPHRSRSYRIVARGFCTEPARAVAGTGAVLISRFDYAGRVDFETEDTASDAESDAAQLDLIFARSSLQIATPDARLHPFRVWIADNDTRRARGLMFVKQLDDDAGMLFIYPSAQRIAMWMKNTFIPLDMLFVTADGRVARVVENTQPQSLDTIESGSAVIAVVELTAGTAKRLHIRADAQVIHPAFAPR